ncbi:MAG: CorA family divalent cation transporter [Verrucomicrobiota bacterium JB023]|nr:CorA family divalent cation transporter [Verrucomicrobiota bacterium JB023]
MKPSARRKNEFSYLPENFGIEEELVDQLGVRPGHQRCIEGENELLLVVHEVPKAKEPERDALFFWKTGEGQWLGAEGSSGLKALSDLLRRYARTIDAHEETIDEADTAEEVFGIVRHASPLARSLRNMVAALQQTLNHDDEDRTVRNLLDRARELERAAELLLSDARDTLSFWQAESAEEQSEHSERLNKILFRLNLLAGFFLPVVALSGLFGMNVNLPPFVRNSFYVILSLGLLAGVMTVTFATRKR